MSKEEQIKKDRKRLDDLFIDIDKKYMTGEKSGKYVKIKVMRKFKKENSKDE